MKKILFVLFAAVFISSLCFAAQPKAPAAKTAAKPTNDVVKAEAKPAKDKVKHITVTGKVDTVSVGIAKKTSSEITVIDDKGQKISFLVKSSTIISAKNGKPLKLGEIKKDAKIAIQYKTYRENNKALVIRLLE